MKYKNYEIDFRGDLTFGKEIKTFFIAPLIEYSVCPAYDEADMRLTPGKIHEIRLGWLCLVFSICINKAK